MSECLWLPQVAMLADGELAQADIQSVHAHLASCGPCQQALGDFLAFAALRPAPDGSAQPVIAAAPARPTRWWIPVTATLAMAAALAIWFLAMRSPPRPASVALQLAPTRTVDVMFSGPQFRAYRAYDPLRGDIRREQIPLATIAALQQQAQDADAFAALTVSGDVARAAALPNVRASDRAALELVRGDAEAALVALRETNAPADNTTKTDVPGLWNLALANQRLGLHRTSRVNFMQVATAATDGWSAEAQQRAAENTNALARFDRDFPELEARGTRWVAGDASGEITAADVTRFPAYARIYFYDAARVALTAAELDRLTVVAAALDQQSNSHAAQDAVARARASVQPRAPWVASYRAVVAHTASDAQAAALWRLLVGAGAPADDMLVGAAVLLGKLDELRTLRRTIATWQDPWFDMLRAKAVAQGEPDGGQAQLRALLLQCPKTGLELRCGSIAQALAEALVSNGRDDEAEPFITQAITWFDQAGAPKHHSNARAFRAEILRRRGRLARAQAEFADIARTPGDCALTHYAAIGQANLALLANDWIGVRQALPKISKLVDPTCPAQADMLGLATAVDLARRSLEVADQARAAQWIELAQHADDADMHEVARVAAARLQGAPGQATLVAWLDTSTKLPLAGDTPPLVAALRTWAFATVISNAGAERDWPSVLQHAHAEMYGALPATPSAPGACALVASLDDDLLTVSAQTPTSTWGLQQRVTPAELQATLADRLPLAGLTALRACPAIDVTARPPLHGRSDLLPRDMVWQFMGARRPTAVLGAAMPGRSRLLVADVRPPPSNVVLPGLSAMLDARSAFDVVVSGADATPARVLQVLANATYAEFHVHGLAAAHGDEATQLLLSPDDRGTFALTARQVRNSVLHGAPVVVLAACRAATVAPQLRERWGLPDAFIAAGARAVIAVDVAILDAAATRYFAALRTKLNLGLAPAQAVAELRKTATVEDQAWIDHVMVFAAAP